MTTMTNTYAEWQQFQGVLHDAAYPEEWDHDDVYIDAVSVLAMFVPQEHLASVCDVLSGAKSTTDLWNEVSRSAMDA